MNSKNKKRFLRLRVGLLTGLTILLFTGLVMESLPGPAGGPSSSSDRYYLGEAACRRCHYGTGKNDPHSRWYLSKHAESYAVLAQPESVEIARLSGIDVDPLQSPVCLKCHTTASDTEAWRRDEGFHLEDGIQCESCHGPGSEYAAAEIMAKPDAAMRAGLLMPSEEDCRVCHLEKSSHTSVLKIQPYDYLEFLEAILHPGKARMENEPAHRNSPQTTAAGDDKVYAGAMACLQCHNGTKKGNIYNKWRLSAHAEAYAVLGNKEPCLRAGTQKQRRHRQNSEPKTDAQCLKCHATQKGPGAVHGVHCESCHGPANRHVQFHTLNDNAAEKHAALRIPTKKTCKQCHTGKEFNFQRMKEKIRHCDTTTATETRSIVYKTPFNLTVSPDGKRLYVACEASDSLVVVDTEKRTVFKEITVQNQPHGVYLSDDGKRIYVSNRGSDTVTEIDAANYKVIRHMAVGDEPHDLVTDTNGNFLYVANTGSHDISVVDLKTGLEKKRLSGGRGTWAVKRSPDGKDIYISNNLSHFVKFRTPSRSEVTVIDAKNARVKNRIMLSEANLIQGVDVSPDGQFAMVTLLRTKNLIPITRVMQGWVITNGIGVLWKDGQVDQLLLDEPDRYFADPTDLVITPDGKYAYVTGGGVDAVAVVDLRKMKRLLAETGEERRKNELPNHLGISVKYVLKRIPVGRSPRGLAVSKDGRFVYTADGLDDTVSVIDTARQQRVAVIDLGGPREITLARKGERIFHSAEVTYGRQFSCHTCHPDGGIDGITYDIEPDGLGVNPVDNRTLRGILDTAPFKWTGKNPSLSRQCGPRLAVFFTRIDPFTPEQVVALDRYICTIPRNPNRYRKGTELTEAQRRGKLLFERTHTNSGEMIPKENRCNFCHSGPYYTNRQRMDVGTRFALDTNGRFDVPHLNNIYETAPFLHDGSSDTLEEIWTMFNPDDKHGVTNDMTKDQLNDLVEYLKTL
jgi:YVTN family beta-propeller protein